MILQFLKETNKNSPRIQLGTFKVPVPQARMLGPEL